MPAKRHICGRVTRWVVRLCVVLFLFGPTSAPASTQAHISPFEQTKRVVAPSAANRLVVTSTSDLVDGNTSSVSALNSQPGGDGVISLREAILATNATLGSEPLSIEFNIPISSPGYNSANATWTISPGLQALPPLTRGGVTIDGTTQPGSRSYPQIILDGYNVYEGAGLNNGITISSADNLVRGLSVINFYDNAILISGAGATRNTVAGCYIGTDARGGSALPNGTGVRIGGGAHGNLIGGASSAARNLISGNNFDSGVVIQDATTHNNVVAGNRIGTSASGQRAIANTFSGIHLSNGTYDNLIGGAGQGNLISGNDLGIYIAGSPRNTVWGNTIGLAADGQTSLGNSNGGIFIVGGARDNLIGGNGGLRNTISANGRSSAALGQGIYISDLNTINNAIQGNFIGVDSSGVQPIGNSGQGVLIANNAQGNIIGGTSSGAGNIIANNGRGGVRLDAPANQVAGNLIGVGVDGTTPLGNQFNGVRVGSDSNTIGPNNLIAHNQHSGIMLTGLNTMVVSNTLQSNGRSGICVTGANTTINGNAVLRNGTGSGPWPDCNIRGGIVITGTDNTLVSGNEVLFNTDAGITVYQGHSNRILVNSISENGTAGIELAHGGNNDVAPPTIEKVTGTTVSGRGCPLCRVDIFTDIYDEGRYYAGTTTAQSDGTFTLTIAPTDIHAPHLTATDTDDAGNTSPFAAAVAVPLDNPGPLPSPTPRPTPGPNLHPHHVFLPAVRR